MKSTPSGDGYIETVTVVHFVELVFRLDVTQLGIGQHGQGGFPLKNTMLTPHRIDSIKILQINTLT